MPRRFSSSLLVGFVVLASIALGAQEKAVTASAGWVAEPAAGATTASAFLQIENPTMYDVYIVSAAADVAGSVELHEQAGGASKATKELTVPAFGSLELKPDAAHLVLKALTRPLKKGETVNLTVKTDGGVTLKVPATVR